MAAQFSQTVRALASDDARGAYVVWAGAALLLAAWLAWFFGASVTVVEVSRKARLEVQQAAHAVAAPLSGRVLSSTLAIGAQVRAGDLLLELDAGAEQLRLREEQARLDAIPPRIASLNREIALREQGLGREQRAALAAAQSARFRIDEAEAAVEFARDQQRRLDEESRAGSIARSEALRALAEARKLGASRDALGADLTRLESDAQTRSSAALAQIETLHRSVAALAGELATGQATIARLTATVERHRIRAPVDGRVGDLVALRAGSHVAEGQKIASVVPPGALMIVAEFEPSAVLGRVLPGQPARMRLDGFPWAQYGSIAARVSGIASEIRDGLVRVEFVPMADAAAGVALQHGLPGAIEVEIEAASPAALVWRAAGQKLSAPPRPLAVVQGPRP